MGKRDRNGRVAKERAARERRTANAKPPAALPMTEASVALAAALQAAGQSGLAERARRLQFDENYSADPFPLRTLVAELARAGLPQLIDRVAAGEFDSTPADNEAFAATPRGRAELAEYEQAMADPQVAAAAERFGEAVKNADPRRLEQIAKQGIAEIAEEATGAVLVDDDEIVDPGEIHHALRGMLGERGPDGQRLDTPEILAAAEMAFRSGGQEFEIGWLHDDVPAEQRAWYAHATYQGTRLRVDGLPGPGAAAATFVSRVLDGGQCQLCGKLSTTDPARALGGDKTLLNGKQWTQADQVKAGICVWRRQGPHWVEGCRAQQR